MGVLQAAKAAMIICTRERSRATAFYRDVLGLELAQENELAAVFQLGGATLRVSFVADFTPHEHTVLGFQVQDVRATVQALRERGVVFKRFPHFPQDEQDILTLPGGTHHVVWFQDPDGNLLSITDLE